MKNFTAADLQSLARGRSVSSGLFRAILADGEAVQDLTRLLQVEELRDTPGSSGPAKTVAADELEPVPEMTVTWDELTRYAEQRLYDSNRVLAVEHFLEKHFPDDLKRLRAAFAGGETHFDVQNSDTHIDFRSAAHKQAPPGKHQSGGRPSA
jgi:hypothetical protein